MALGAGSSVFLLALLVGCDTAGQQSYDVGVLAQTADARTGEGKSARPGKVDVCHYDADADAYHLISVADRALPAHERHGDGRPGGPVPGSEGSVFDGACQPVPPSCPCAFPTSTPGVAEEILEHQDTPIPGTFRLTTFVGAGQRVLGRVNYSVESGSGSCRSWSYGFDSPQQVIEEEPVSSVYVAEQCRIDLYSRSYQCRGGAGVPGPEGEICYKTYPETLGL